MDLFDWKLTAGQRLVWTGAARYLRLVECLGAIVVDYDYEAPEYDQFRTKMIRGVGVDLSHPDSNARAKNIGFTSPVDQTLTVLVSELPTTDSRLSGTVSVIDGARSLVDSGVSYGVAMNCPAMAGEYSHAQIWNPLGSGKNIIVSQVIISSPAAQILAVGKYNTALSVAGSDDAANKDFSVSTIRASKKRRQNGGAALFFDAVMWWQVVGASNPQRVDFVQPVILRPGNGLMLQSGVVNVDIYLTAQIIEEAV